MTTPINLNKRRKAQQRAEKTARADANAAKFGQTKAERAGAATRLQQQADRLAQHKIDK